MGYKGFFLLSSFAEHFFRSSFIFNSVGIEFWVNRCRNDFPGTLLSFVTKDDTDRFPFIYSVSKRLSHNLTILHWILSSSFVLETREWNVFHGFCIIPFKVELFFFVFRMKYRWEMKRNENANDHETMKRRQKKMVQAMAVRDAHTKDKTHQTNINCYNQRMDDEITNWAWVGKPSMLGRWWWCYRW